MKSAIIACVVVGCLWAGPATARKKCPAGGEHIAGVIRGTLAAESSGPCVTFEGSYCPSGNCQCEEFAGRGSGSPQFRGPADVFVTIDYGAEVSPGCYALYATIPPNTPPFREVIHVIGTACTPSTGIAAGSSTSSRERITGDFGIGGFNVTSPGLDGSGAVKGKIKLTTGAVKLNFSGSGHCV